MLKIADLAPDFCLPNQDDVEICLHDLKGKWVVLYFYPKDNTPGCTTEACDFTERMPEFEEQDAVILGVSPDTTQKHRNFIEKKGLKITLLSDTEKEVLKKYGAWGLKKMYGKEFEGVIRSTFLIDPEGKIAYIWPKVKVKGHAEEVKEKLKELRKGKL
ncbi:thioredoxin-dependent thiol peroxidase [Nitrosophilus alvini]|uniref:thioredoxin-dependent thiol peroxidase n=1 Tax=Nitrosophilus alvini TaxID=2714855 RepID=UPI00190BA4C1|nr:thioredoxin-dependent thiol peroxidase [Nitrosophilus alvini]